AGGHLERAEINEQDRETHRQNMKVEVSDLYSKLEHKPDYVVMGYANAFKDELEAPGSPWKITSPPKTVHTSGGITGTLFKVQSQTDPAIQRTFLTTTVQQTLWGEGSSFLAEGLLAQNPRGIVFLGSAGSLGTRGKIYDVTVPEHFSTSDAQVPIDNDLNTF